MSEIQKFDQLLFYLINTKLSNEYFDTFFPAITDLHKTTEFRFIFLPLVLILLVYFQRLRGFIIFVGLAISQGLSDYVGNLGKHFWQRPRPFQVPDLEVIQRTTAGGFSFPSNHAINMFCVAVFLSTFFPKYRFLFFLMAALVAFSRVYNGVHFPFDILSGSVLGIFVGLLGSEITLRVIRKIEIHFDNGKRDSHG